MQIFGDSFSSRRSSRCAAALRRLQRHGGDAWLESVEGEGTTFFLSIPLKAQNLVVSEE